MGNTLAYMHDTKSTIATIADVNPEKYMLKQAMMFNWNLIHNAVSRLPELAILGEDSSKVMDF